MTREHKLALIVGFSLILLVGVLISDHLSSARQAQVGDYGPGDFRASELPLLLPTDPLRASGPGRVSGGSDWADAGSPAAVMDEVPQLPSTVGRVSEGHPGARQVDPGPLVIRQGTLSAMDPAVDPALSRAIAEHGGTIRHEGGVAEIVLPAAAQRTGGVERSAPAPRERVEEAFDWYTVQGGESLYKIAAKHYGDGKLWRELQRANADRVGENGSVRAGVKIRVPRRDEGRGPVVRTVAMQTPAPREAPRETPRAEPAVRSYTVQRGDTLGLISQKTLGTSRRWREIMELNGIEDEDHVQAGTVLKIPGR